MTKPDRADEQAAALLPCPFCGASGEDVQLNPNGTVIKCWECGAHGPILISEGDAAYKWNRRVPNVEEAIREARLSAYETAAKIAARYWHTSGTECDDRENCGIVIHNNYRPETVAKLIRALVEKEQG